ncbi:hypothetical protein NUU61_002287 [Penicillium alfredii]|uniref:DUF8035 domain-containing protein n=1 Tax=Penicillium alfredii TaxID=1506179 RepID=A0A9W9KFV5_9EURO|nr:uncharacterized protein NUU61_002287 [Penicillium alfredii]KAJ5104940.1 hypothetical protein NUU61_002287 [Penicillium alfredii]
MGSSDHYRTLSPGAGRSHMVDPMRASTGMVQLGSSQDPYETARRYDYDEYPSDVGYGSAYRHRPSRSSMLEARPVASQTYRDPNQATKKRTEYSVQPSRHRSNTTSAADYETPLRLAVPSSSHPRHSQVMSASPQRSASPLPYDSAHYLASTSQSGGRHRRMYSTDYASDTGRLDPRDSKARVGHGAHRVHPAPGRRRYPPYTGLKKGDDIDDYDAYSYTTPREQFDRDYPVRPRHPRGGYTKDRPLSMTGMEDHLQWPSRKEPRSHGPPPTSRGLDKLDQRDGGPRGLVHDADNVREMHKPKGDHHDRALVVVPHDSDFGYSSRHDDYSDGRRRHRPRRPHHDREFDRAHEDDRHSKPHDMKKALPGLGTAALGAGYSDLSDYDHRPARRSHRRLRDDEHYKDPRLSSRGLTDDVPSPEKSKQLYLESGDSHRRRRSRKPSRRAAESDSDALTSDEDLRNYRREPAALDKGDPDSGGHGLPPRSHRRPHNPEHDNDPAHSSPRGPTDGGPPSPDQNKQLYLEPGDTRRPRRRSRRRVESDLDAYSSDEDLRNYRGEAPATTRRRHSSTDTSSKDRSRSRSRRHRSSRPQRLLEDDRRRRESRHSPRDDRTGDGRRPVTVEPPASKEPEAAPKGILKAPRESFPEEPNPVREGVAPLNKKGIPPGARWTKVDRRLVNPAALEAGNERFEERSEYVIVLRVLSKEEIQAYAVKTQEIRDARHKEYLHDKRRRRDESRRHGRHDDFSSDDEDEDDGAPRQIEAPPTPAPESENLALPSRPRAPSNSPDDERPILNAPAQG